MLKLQYISISKKFWILCVKVRSQQRIYLIVSLYRSPSDGRDEFLEFIQNWCDQYICDEHLFLTEHRKQLKLENRVTKYLKRLKPKKIKKHMTENVIKHSQSYERKKITLRK